MNLEKYKQFLEVVRPNNGKRFKVTYKDRKPETIRLFVSANNLLCRFRKRSRRRGPVFSDREVDLIESIFQTPVNTDKKRIFERNCSKILKYLDSSGLWTELRQEVAILSELGYENTNKALSAYFNSLYMEGETSEDREKRIESNVRRISEKLYKYCPEVEKEECFLSDWSYSLFEPRGIKTVYFGKYRNKMVLEQISNALKNKCKYDSGRFQNGSYEASFSYEPSKNRAWYSEEYVDCGNGYYYRALDGKHVLFCGKD